MELNLLDPINVILGDTQEFRGINHYPTYTCGEDDDYKISKESYLDMKKFVIHVIEDTTKHSMTSMVTAVSNGSLAMKLSINLSNLSYSFDFKYLSPEEFNYAFIDIYESLITLPEGVTLEKTASVAQNPAIIDNAIAEIAFTYQEPTEEDVQDEE